MPAWKPVVGFEDFYEVSDDGHVRSLRDRLGRLRPEPKNMALSRRAKGYMYVILKDHRSHRVHRLVLGAFVGPCPDGHEGAHLNGVHDDNRLENLAWVSRKENQAHRYTHRTATFGTDAPAAKLNEQVVTAIRRLHDNERVSLHALSRAFDMNLSTLGNLLNGKQWKHLPSAYGDETSEEQALRFERFAAFYSKLAHRARIEQGTSQVRGPPSSQRTEVPENGGIPPI